MMEGKQMNQPLIRQSLRSSVTTKLFLAACLSLTGSSATWAQSEPDDPGAGEEDDDRGGMGADVLDEQEEKEALPDSFDRSINRAPVGQPSGETGAPPKTDAPQSEPQVRETHLVETGDTLWDLCTKYLNSPWYW